MGQYQLTPDAVDDLDEIWRFIAEGNEQAADRVENEILAACAWLADGPGRGHRRTDITGLPVRFWSLVRYSNYTIVYGPETKPLQIIRILHAKRDLKGLLK